MWDPGGERRQDSAAGVRADRPAIMASGGPGLNEMGCAHCVSTILEPSNLAVDNGWTRDQRAPWRRGTRRRANRTEKALRPRSGRGGVPHRPLHDFDSPNLGDSPLPGRLPSQGNRRRHQGYLIKEGVATGGTRSGCSAPRSAQSAGTGPLVRGMARLSWAFWPIRGPYGVAKGARTWLLHCGGVGPSGDWRTSQGLAPVPQRAGREAAVVQCGPGGDQ